MKSKLQTVFDEVSQNISANLENTKKKIEKAIPGNKIKEGNKAIKEKLTEIANLLPDQATEIKLPFPNKPIKFKKDDLKQLEDISKGNFKFTLPLDLMDIFPDNPWEAFKVALSQEHAKEFAKNTLAQAKMTSHTSYTIKKAFKDREKQSEKINTGTFQYASGATQSGVINGGQSFIFFSNVERTLRQFFPLNILVAVLTSQEAAFGATKSGLELVDSFSQINKLHTHNDLQFQRTTKMDQIASALSMKDLPEEDRLKVIEKLHDLSSLYKDTLDKVSEGALTEVALEKFNNVQSEYFKHIQKWFPGNTIDAIRTLVSVKDELNMRKILEENEINKQKQQLEFNFIDSDKPDIKAKAQEEDAIKLEKIDLQTKKDKLQKLFNKDISQDTVDKDREKQRVGYEKAEKIHKSSTKKRPERDHSKLNRINASNEERQVTKTVLPTKQPLTPEEIGKFESQLSPDTLRAWKTNYANIDVEYDVKRRLIESRSSFLYDILTQDTPEAKALNNLMLDNISDNFIMEKMPVEKLPQKSQLDIQRAKLDDQFKQKLEDFTTNEKKSPNISNERNID